MRTITPEDLFQFHLVGAPSIHPTQPLIAYQEEQANRDTNHNDAWIMAVEPGSPPRRFTQGPSDRHPQFSPDGKYLAFISERSGTKQIWVMPTDGGEPRQVSHFKGAVQDCQWLPHSEGLVCIALIGPQGIDYDEEKEPDDPYRTFNRDVKVITESFHKFDGVGYFDERRPHLVILPLAEGAPPRQLTVGPMRHSGLAVSPDGQWIATTSRYGEDYDRQAGRNHLYLVDASGGQPPKALTADPLSVELATFAPNGRDIYFLAENWTEMGYDNLTLYATTLDGTPPIRVVPHWDRPFADVSLSDMPAPAGNPLQWAGDGRHLYVLTSCDGATRMACVNIDAGAIELMTDREEVCYSYALSPDSNYAAVAIATPSNPGHLRWLNLSNHETIPLANPNQTILEELTLSQPLRLKARAGDGPPVDVWIMPPINLSAGQKAPTALEIHGGPMMMYAQSFFFEFQWLAANGYGVVYCNPRGSQGYGHEFCRAIQKEWGNLDAQDIFAALDTAIAHFDWIDERRLGIMGGSYGGYMTNWILGHSTRFKAGISMRSVADWRTMIGTGDVGWHWISRTGGEWPWSENDAWYRQQSPITYVENIVAPLLIEHQEGDLRCPIDQGQSLFMAMKYFNKAPVKLIRYPDEFHGMSRNGQPWHRAYRLNTLTDWFDQYL